MPAISPCEYELITIESDQGVTIDLRLGVVSFQYYEDLFSPTITAKMIISMDRWMMSLMLWT